MLIVKASRCILDRLIKLFAQWYNERLKTVLFQCFVVTATTDTCVSFKASIEAQNVRESLNLLICLVTPI